MANRLFLVVGILVLTGLPAQGQSKPSIQGVWRVVETTITGPNPAPGTLPTGTHTNVQPGVVIFTAKHYSSMRDGAAKPRPTAPFKVAGKPTSEEMQSAWGPLQANTGTYELVGTTLTMRPIVAKNPALQNSAFLRMTTKLDGNNLTLTLVEVSTTGKVTNPLTVKYVRLE